MNNPVMEEQLRAGFINFTMIRLHLIGLAVITFLVFLFYPSQSISYFLARSVKPEMFSIALYTVLTFISYLTIKTAIFSIQNAKIISIIDWFSYTGISVFTYIWGRISYGLFYTSFLTLLFLPVLLVSGSVSAIGPFNIMAIVLFIYLLILNLFFIGLFFFTLFKKPHWILTLIIWIVLLSLLFLSPLFFPDNHPTLLLMKLQESDDLLILLRTPLIVSGFSISFLILFCWLSLYFFRRSVHDT